MAKRRQNKGDSGAPEATGRDWLDWRVVRLVLAVKFLILFYGCQSYQVLSDRGAVGLRGWLEIWNRWDALHYLALAEHGYVAAGERSVQIAFFPLYPWLTRALALLVGDYLFSAFLLSGLCSVGAGLLLKNLIETDYGEVPAFRAVWFMLIFPTSYVLHVPYTESLMLTLTLGCFLAARRERWALAGLLGAAASLSRINGMILAPALAVEIFLRFRRTRKWDWRWLWVLAIPAGFLGYLLLNKVMTGSFFTFLQVQQSHWFKSLTWPWVGLGGAFGSMSGRPPTEAVMVGWQEIFFALVGLACTIFSWIKLRPAYAVWMTLNWLLITSTSFLLSVPRYLVIMFPIYLTFALLSEREIWKQVITLWSILYLALFIGQFVRGHWAF